MKEHTHFEKELLESEYLRVKMLAWVLGSTVFTGLLAQLILPEFLQKVFNNPQTMWIIFGIAFGVFIFELIILFEINRLKKRGGFPPDFVRFLGTAVEISFASAVLFFAVFHEQTLEFLAGPPFLFYFFFIILSSLRLNFWLATFAGFIAGVQYIVISIWLVNYFPEGEEASLFTLYGFHIEKGILLFLAGLLAGFVAKEINKRIKSSFEAEQERNKVKMLFGQQVSPEVMSALLNDGLVKTSQQLEVTIMFMDIRDFTPFAETKTPEEIIAFQNAIFSPIIEIIHQHEGIINQIMGDGFMATFGAPIGTQNHSEKAIKSGMAIVQRVKDLANEKLIPPTKVGIGLHTGKVVAGNIGNNIRQQYSITGTTVITAARIEQLNKQFGTQFLMSHSTFMNANGLSNDFELLDKVTLKGQEKPLEVYKMIE